MQFDGVGGPNSEDWRKGLALCLLCGLSIIRENTHKKEGIKIGLDYRCILPVRVVDPYLFFTDPDPDPELDVGGQYGSGSNTDPGL